MTVVGERLVVIPRLFRNVAYGGATVRTKGGAPVRRLGRIRIVGERDRSATDTSDFRAAGGIAHSQSELRQAERRIGRDCQED